MAIRTTSRQTQGSDHFDLLPFIALMMIVLATLLFITMTMATINVGAGAAEGWVPAAGADSHKKVPVLVEWDGETVTIHKPSDHERISIGKETRLWWNSDWDFRSAELRNFLAEMIRKKETHYILFAVRPSGFGNFQTLASEFRDKGISVGYEPIDQGKAVRLQLDEEAAR